MSSNLQIRQKLKELQDLVRQQDEESFTPDPTSITDINNIVTLPGATCPADMEVCDPSHMRKMYGADCPTEYEQPKPWLYTNAGLPCFSQDAIQRAIERGENVRAESQLVADTAREITIPEFIDGELRGIGVPTAVPFGPYAGTYQFFTLIYSNAASGETVTLKFYDAETDAVYDIAETYDYISDMTHGNVMIPSILNTSGITSDAYASCEGDDCPSGVYDCAGTCDGSAVEDCAGYCNGPFYIDECDSCVGSPDPNCVQDCLGEWGGNAVVDECDICDADPSNDNLTCLDCAGTPNGTAYIDQCDA